MLSSSWVPGDEDWADYVYSCFTFWEIVTEGGHRTSLRAQSWKVGAGGLVSCGLRRRGPGWVAGHQELWAPQCLREFLVSLRAFSVQRKDDQVLLWFLKLAFYLLKLHIEKPSFL